MFYSLNKKGLYVEKEKPIPLIFETVKLDGGYILDLLVENKLVIEIKSVETLNDIHLAQTLTYLKIGNLNLDCYKKGRKQFINISANFANILCKLCV